MQVCEVAIRFISFASYDQQIVSSTMLCGEGSEAASGIRVLIYCWYLQQKREARVAPDVLNIFSWLSGIRILNHFMVIEALYSYTVLTMSLPILEFKVAPNCNSDQP